MRITVPVDDRNDRAVRDPSLVNPIGRVLAVVDHGDGRLTVEVDLDDEMLRARLAERRGAF
jgi:hypothetical protein